MRRIPLTLALVLVLGACSPAASSGPSAPSPTRPAASPVAPLPSPSEPPAEAGPEPLPESSTFVVVPAARWVPMYAKPEARKAAFSFGTRNWSGRRAPLLVLDDHVDGAGERWFEVQLPVRPNGRSAWIREADVRRLHVRRERIVVDLSSHTLRHYRGERLLHRLKVGIGAMATPTAVGTFSVWVKMEYEDASGPYGPFALGLSGFSPVLEDWPGGGRLAIHGTGNPADRGRQVSHGCIRVYNPELELLRDVPLGTPVTIRR